MALKIVYQICCSIDVHKTFIVASIASTSKQGVTAKSASSLILHTRVDRILQWLLDK
jgi:hypothetical protein